MGKKCVVLGILLTVSALWSVYGTMWYVDDSVLESGDGSSWESAFKTIQEGINAAGSGDTVMVAEGVYVENIHFDGKNIILRSSLPLDGSVVANTIIDGNQSGSVVTFAGTEDASCVLCGFTIRNGYAEGGGGICGGIWGGTVTARTLATIESNIITGNSASYGGGMVFCDGTIQNNLVVRNYAATFGGGLYDCDGTIQNNTVVENEAFIMAGGLYDCTGTFGPVQNCIVWGNMALVESQISGTYPIYSCIQYWSDGTGNISDNPLFVNETEGDYRLQANSPCIDAGTSEAPGLPLIDLDGNLRIADGDQDNEAIVDMGAFEFQTGLADIEVSPPEYDFGAVEVGASSATAVTITNVGDGLLVVHTIGLTENGGGQFSITSSPGLPAMLPPVELDPVKGSVSVEITYSPSAAELSSATLEIASNDPGEAVVQVSLVGTGVETERSPEEQIAEILEFFDESVAGESLTGSGPGRSAKGRVKALENMLEAARGLIEGGYYQEARRQLLDVYARTDGFPRPPDFVTGDAAEELAAMILELVASLGGE